MAEINPVDYSSLEALGICTIDAGGETNIPDMAKLYRELGKRVFAICDKQTDGNKALIEAQVELLLMHEEKGFENLVLKNTTEDALKRFTKLIDWPSHIKTKYADIEAEAMAALTEYFGWTKANWGVAEFLAQCSETEIPNWLREACLRLKTTLLPAPVSPPDGTSSAPVAPAHAAVLS